MLSIDFVRENAKDEDLDDILDRTVTDYLRSNIASMHEVLIAIYADELPKDLPPLPHQDDWSQIGTEGPFILPPPGDYAGYCKYLDLDPGVSRLDPENSDPSGELGDYARYCAYLRLAHATHEENPDRVVAVTNPNPYQLVVYARETIDQCAVRLGSRWWRITCLIPRGGRRGRWVPVESDKGKGKGKKGVRRAE
jgi:hypothetical protein